MNQKFNRWIFESFRVSGEGLGLLRIFVSLFILAFLIPGMGTSHFIYLSGIPADFYAPPPGPMMLQEQFPPHFVFQAIHAVLLLSLCAMLAGYRTKGASITTGICILLLQGLIFSVGKINHEILVPLVPLAMAFSNWGACFSVDSLRLQSQKTSKGFEPLTDCAPKVESWPLVLLALSIGFMMFTAGFPKILGGWLDPSTQAAQGHLFNQFFVRERQALLSGFFVRFDQPLFWELLDWATILFEVGFLVAVVKVSWFRFFVCLAVLFHFSTLMTLNIAFLPNFLGYAVFLNWDRIYQGVHQIYKRFTGRQTENRPVMLAGLILAIFFLFLRWLSRMDLILADSELMLYEVVFLTLALVVVGYLVVKKGTSRVQARLGKNLPLEKGNV